MCERDVTDSAVGMDDGDPALLMPSHLPRPAPPSSPPPLAWCARGFGMDMVRVQQKTRGQNCLESRDARLAQQLARLVRDLDLLHRVIGNLYTRLDSIACATIVINRSVRSFHVNFAHGLDLTRK